MAGSINMARGTSRFSFKQMAICGFVLSILFLLVVAIAGAVFAVRDMQSNVKLSLNSAEPQIESRIDESFKLLESLAEQPTLYDPSVPVMDKVAMLDQVNEHFQYFLLCYVDTDINVWDADGPASLASRDFMQKLYSTGESLVTDSFAAGADGVTLNYVVLVPLLDQQGTMTGSLFVSLYFNEVVDTLNASLATDDMESVLVGSRGQVMSATSGYVYDDQFLDPIRGSIAFGMTADAIETELLALNPVNFWTIDGLNVNYYAAAPVAGTNWDVVCVSNFWNTYARIMGSFAPMIIVVLLVMGAVYLLMRRDFGRQMESARMLEHSVEELQKKVYSEERPGDADIADILELTSSGLSDGLTGVVTRSVFTSRLESMLDSSGNEDALYALCFIDLDDFKNINDSYGHATGDIALKSIGYLLREYERRYDGLVGRYGGDEFVLLMTDLDSEMELKDVLDELISGLHVDVRTGDSVFSVHCSVGVAIWDHKADADEFMERADQALYDVKQHGKEGYCIYRAGEES